MLKNGKEQKDMNVDKEWKNDNNRVENILYL
jgi:hypothetical protein